jgi:hypothetical protein
MLNVEAGGRRELVASTEKEICIPRAKCRGRVPEIPKNRVSRPKKLFS